MGEVIVAVLVIGAFVLLANTLVNFSRQRASLEKKRLGTIMRDASAQFDGPKVGPKVRKTANAPTTLELSHGNARVSVSFRTEQLHSESTPQRRTLVELHHQRVSPAIELAPEGFKLFKLFQDIQVGDGSFDAKYTIRGEDEPTVQRVLNENSIRAIRTLHAGKHVKKISLNNQGFVCVVDGWIESETALTTHIRKVLHVYDTLMDTYRAPMEQFARDRGLTFTEGNHLSGYEMSGAFDGITLSVSHIAKTQTFGVEASWPSPSVEPLVLIHKDKKTSPPATFETVDLANPVLDHMIRAYGDDPEEVRTLLNRPGIADAVLPVVHAFPGSLIRHDEVRLVTTTADPQRMGEALDAVLAAAKAISAAKPQTLPREALQSDGDSTRSGQAETEGEA